jgi:hypothetical protein
MNNFRDIHVGWARFCAHAEITNANRVGTKNVPTLRK